MTSMTVTATLNTAVLDSLMAGLIPNVDAALQETAAACETDIKINIQSKRIIDTGRLLNSIHFERVEKLTYEVSDGVEYGIYQELGTRRIVARPFFIPGIEKNATVLWEKIGAAVSK